MLLRLLAVLSTALPLTAAAVAADHIGVASGKALYRFDSVTGQVVQSARGQAFPIFPSREDSTVSKPGTGFSPE